MEFWPGVIIPRWIVTRVRIPRQNVTPGHNSTLNCDLGSWFHVEVRPQVSIQRWIVTPSHDSTLNCHLVLGSQFNVEFWPRVIIQRGILTRGYNSMWNSDPSTYLLPVELRLKKVSKFNSVIKIQQLRRVTIQRKIHWILTPGRYSIGGSKFYLTRAYGVFISQLIRCIQGCSSYECFILMARWHSSKPLKQGYLKERLTSSLRKFYSWYGDLIQQYEVSLWRMLNDILTIDQ